MKWYVDKYEELKHAKPIISVCGDDCAVCPRYLAQTEEELHETALFWYRAGWRDHVLSNEEIRCTGCGCRPTCSFMLLPCTKEHHVSRCYDCKEFQCEKVTNMLAGSYEKMQQCKAVCESDREFELFKRAFYEKEMNLGKEMIDRLCSHAGNIIAMLKSVLSGKNGTDLYIVTLYSAGLAGIACHEAVKALGKPMTEVRCANGKTYYMGDALNKYLHEDVYSVTAFARAITQMPESAVIEIVQRQANVLGTEHFLVSGNLDPDSLYKNIKMCWDGIKDNMTLQYCKKPEEWPVLYGIVLQNVMRESMNYASIESPPKKSPTARTGLHRKSIRTYDKKEAIFNSAVDVACALSKMDSAK